MNEKNLICSFFWITSINFLFHIKRYNNNKNNTFDPPIHLDPAIIAVSKDVFNGIGSKQVDSKIPENSPEIPTGVPIPIPISTSVVEAHLSHLNLNNLNLNLNHHPTKDLKLEIRDTLNQQIDSTKSGSSTPGENDPFSLANWSKKLTFAEIVQKTNASNTDPLQESMNAPGLNDSEQVELEQ